jgi:TetR/AcrR family transcriptional repressor of nem operon
MGERMETSSDGRRRRGRPRSVDPADALDAAMRVFWSEGYDGASIDHLCRETGMPRASLYQDFGGKEGLFLAAIAHYVETQLGPVAEALGPHGSLAEDLGGFFDEVVALATRDAATPGCLISCVLAEVAGANETFRQELDRRFTALEEGIARRLDSGTEPTMSGETQVLAGMLAAVARGIMLRARSGAEAPELRAITRVAVRSAVRDLGQVAGGA